MECVVFEVWTSFLGVFAKLRETSVGFVMSVCLSVWNSSARTGSVFMKLDIFLLFENLSRKFQFHYNLRGTTIRHFMCRPTYCVHCDRADRHTVLCTLWPCMAQFFWEWEMLQSFTENQNTHFVFSKFFRKSCRLWDNVEKIWYSRAGHRWQCNTAHALLMLDKKKCYRHTLRTSNVYCFFHGNRITRTRLNATFRCTMPVVLTEMERVYCAVRTEYLCSIIQISIKVQKG